MSFCGAALLMLSAHWFPSGKEGQLPTTGWFRAGRIRPRGCGKSSTWGRGCDRGFGQPDSLVDVLYGDLETPALTELAQLSQLNFGILSMVHSADSRIQSHTFRCPLFSPAVSDHDSTNPASFSPWARPHAKRCSTTKVLPNHWSVRLDVFLDPLFASGSERAEQENCALIANQYVRGIWGNLRRTAHGCVLLWSNT